uniref:Uncharacterized protein n=1 Tax=Tetranychus urticae TaxID=32264 RepID=T1KE71_TETUR
MDFDNLMYFLGDETGKPGYDNINSVVTNSANCGSGSNLSGLPPPTNSLSDGTDQQTVKKRRIKNLGPPVRPQCPECGKDFSNQSALSKHKLTHSDERRFVCNLCQKAFKRQDHLNGHMLTHRDKKPFECDVEGCEKTYCDARSLRRHKENHHAAINHNHNISVNGALQSKPAQIAANTIKPGSISFLSSAATQLQLLALQGQPLYHEKILNTLQPDPSQINHQHQPQASPPPPQQLPPPPLHSSHHLQPNIHLHLKERNSSVKMEVDDDPRQVDQVFGQPILRRSINDPQLNQVECSICQKRFKNLQALNGHMRTHGGYLRPQQIITANNSNSSESLKKEDNVTSVIMNGAENNVNTNNVNNININNNNKVLFEVSMLKNKIMSKHAINNLDVSPNNNHSGGVTNGNDNKDAKEEDIDCTLDLTINLKPTGTVSPISSCLTKVIQSSSDNGLIVEAHNRDTHTFQSDSNQELDQLLSSTSKEDETIKENSPDDDHLDANYYQNINALKEQLQQNLPQFRIPNDVPFNNSHDSLRNRSQFLLPGEKSRRHSDSAAEMIYSSSNSHYESKVRSWNESNHGTNANVNGNNNNITNTTANHDCSLPTSSATNFNNPTDSNFDLLKRRHQRATSDPGNGELDDQDTSSQSTAQSDQLANNNNNLLTINVAKIYSNSNHNHHYSNYNNHHHHHHHSHHHQMHSHSVPTTPTNLNPLLSPAVPHQISNPTNNFNQSLPCTPTQTNSFSFSPHQVQQYHQQQASLPATPTDNQMQFNFPAQQNSVNYSSPSYNISTNNPSSVPTFDYSTSETPTTPTTPAITSTRSAQPGLEPIYEEMNYSNNEETNVNDVGFVNFEDESLIEQMLTTHEQEHNRQNHHHQQQQQQQQQKPKNTQNATNYNQVSTAHLESTQQESDHSDQLVLSNINKSQSFFPNDDLEAQSLDGSSVNYSLTAHHHNQRAHQLNQHPQQSSNSSLSQHHPHHHPHHHHHQQQQHQQQQQQHHHLSQHLHQNHHPHIAHHHNLQHSHHQHHQQQHHQQQTLATSQFNRHPNHHHQSQHSQHILPSITITNTSPTANPIHRNRSGKGLNEPREGSESFVETHYVQSNLFKEERDEKETCSNNIRNINSSNINSSTIGSTSVFNSTSGASSSKVDENELMESNSCSIVTSTSSNSNNIHTNNNNPTTTNNNTINITHTTSNTPILSCGTDSPTPRSTLRSSSSNLVINLSPEEAKDIDEDDDEDDEDDEDDADSNNNGKDETIGISYDEDDDDEDDEDEDDDVFINPAVISPVTSPKSNTINLKDNNYKSVNNNSATITSTSTNSSHTSVITNKNSVIKVTPVNERSSPKRLKHKPEPLYIPPHVNAFGQYASRLRSPRLWDPSGLHSLPSHDVNKSSPPPYTPPPMLSPLRKGSGLYWAIINNGNVTPKSATLGTFIHARKSLSSSAPCDTSAVNLQTNDLSVNINSATSTSSSTTLNANSTTNLNTSTILHSKEISICSKSSELIISSTPTTAFEPEAPYDLDLLPSESDIQPHVNIGPQYQASIPAYIGDKVDTSKRYRRERADLVWNPIVLDKLNQPEDLDYYLELACSSCVPGAGRNVEFALHLLYMCNGDLEEAITKLLNSDPIKLRPDHPLIDYQYPESDVWSQEEINHYYQALIKFDKDFHTIAHKVKTKTVKECIQFYYLWKKICPEEYKRLRIIRRRKEQEGLFYGNQVVTKEEETEDNDVDNKSAVEGENGDDDALSIDSPMNASPSSVSSTATSGITVSVGGSSNKDKSGNFPCRVCGKVFSKVKSRSAHMKVHGAGAASNPAYSALTK